MTDVRGPGDRIRIATFYLLCTLLLIYLIAPILVVVPLSFTADSFLIYPIKELSLRWYNEFFVTPQWRHSLLNSVVIGSATTLISTVLGTAAALGLDGLGTGWRRFGGALVILPIVIPPVVVGNSLFFVLGQVGLNSTFIGVIIAHCVIAVPFVVITVGATLRGFDQDLVRAAVGLGASPAVAFRRVMLPLIFPGVVSGAVFAFAISFDEVVITMLIAGPAQETIPLQMFNGIREQLKPTITAAATVLIVISVLMLTSVELLRRSASRNRR